MPLLLALLLASPEAATRRTESLAGRDWHTVVGVLQAQAQSGATRRNRAPIVLHDEFNAPLPVIQLWHNEWGYWSSGVSDKSGAALEGTSVRLNGGFPEALRLVPGIIIR